MIFTSYFAKLKKMPDNFHSVAICQFPPKWYDGPVYKPLAPTPQILRTYKENVNSNPFQWEEWYNEHYKDSILKGRSVLGTIIEIEQQLPANVKSRIMMNPDCPIWENEEEHIVLICFEKSGDFCHRNQVADWMVEHGYPCREATDSDFIEQKQISNKEEER